jgi:release factor glutamine methyltransferase
MTAAGRDGPLAARLMAAGFVAADEEARELRARAGGDDALLEALVARRLTGEPLAWITGTAVFCGLELRVEAGVYVPRWHTEALAERAAARLPPRGTALDLCTGCGALAAVLAARRPRARVLAADLDPRAVACARGNGVDAVQGDLFDGFPSGLRGTVDVVCGVVPFVPTAELGLLQRDTFAFEGRLAYDGGPDGARLLRRAVREAPAWLRPGGALLLELGGDQADRLSDALAAAGFASVLAVHDDEGDSRGVEATLA